MGGQLDIFNHDIIGLSGEEEKVWRVVREHTGRGNAIKVDALEGEIKWNYLLMSYPS